MWGGYVFQALSVLWLLIGSISQAAPSSELIKSKTTQPTHRPESATQHRSSFRADKPGKVSSVLSQLPL